MADPIIQQPTLTINTSASSVDQIFSDADAARESMFAQASEFFDGQGRVQSATPTPTSPAKPTQSPAEKPDTTTVKDTGKLPPPPIDAAPTKPAESTINDDDIPDFKQGETRAEQWNKLKSGYKDWKAKAADYEKKYKDALTKPQASAANEEIAQRLKQAEQERDSFLQKLEAVAVERSPRFEAMFKPRLDAAVSLAKNAVGPDHATRVEQLLQMPDSEWRTKALDDLAQNLSTLQVSRLGNAVAEMERIHAERQSFVQRGSETFKQWITEEQRSNEARRTEATQQAQSQFDAELNQWRGVEIFKHKDGDAAHNEGVNNRIALAKEIYSGNLPMNELARASVWAASGPHLAAQVKTLAQENAALKSELQSLRSAQPNIAHDTSQGSSEAAPDPNMSYADAIAQSVAQTGLLR